MGKESLEAIGVNLQYNFQVENCQEKYFPIVLLQCDENCIKENHQVEKIHEIP